MEVLIIIKSTDVSTSLFVAQQLHVMQMKLDAYIIGSQGIQ